MNTNNLRNYFKQFTITGSRAISDFPSLSSNYSLQNLKRNNIAKILGVVLLVLVSFFAGSFFSGGKDLRVSAPAPQATQTLNREFKFPLKDDKGATVSQISYLIQSANLQDSFIYQGKVAEAVKGRTFMIINLKITNPYTKSIQINARDYIRVRANGTSEQMAPEIHNDPVQIDAKATKYTRVGLPINDTDKDLELLVGEITGSKTTIKLSLAR